MKTRRASKLARLRTMGLPSTALVLGMSYPSPIQAMTNCSQILTYANSVGSTSSPIANVLATIRLAVGQQDAVYDTHFLHNYIADLQVVSGPESLPRVMLLEKAELIYRSFFPADMSTELQRISSFNFQFFMADVFKVRYSKFSKSSVLDSVVFKEELAEANAVLIPIDSNSSFRITRALRNILALNLRSQDPFLLGVYSHGGNDYLVFELTQPPTEQTQPPPRVRTRPQSRNRPELVGAH
jgi:hypothetical protein